MTFFLLRKRFILLILIGVTLGFGCGEIQTHKKKDPGSPDSHRKTDLERDPKGSDLDSDFLDSDRTDFQPLDLLGLRMIAESQDGKRPDWPDEKTNLNERSFLDEMTGEGEDILIQTLLYLPDPNSPHPDHRKELFFVWPDHALGVPLQSVVYSHRVRGAKHEEWGSLRALPAWHDGEQSRWFVPLSELYKNRDRYQAHEVSPVDTQYLILDLVPEQGLSRRMTIQFQATGGLPLTSVEPLKVVDSNEPTYRRMVHREEMVNPLPREFAIWVRKISKVTVFSVKTFLSLPSYTQQDHAPPLGPTIQYFHSSGELEVKELRVTHQRLSEEKVSQVESFEIQGDSWIRLRFLPEERLILDWWAIPSQNSVFCQLPGQQTQVYYWHTIPEQKYQKVGRMGMIPLPLEPSVLHSLPVHLFWEKVGQSWEGGLNREIRLTHSFTPEADAILSLPKSGNNRHVEYQVLSKEKIQLSQIKGENPKISSPFSCQGLFQ